MKKYLDSPSDKKPSGLPLPVARLTAQEVSEVLRFSEEDMAILMSEKLLEPLGDPPQNGHKYFARVVIEQLAENPAWLDKATAVTTKYWQRKRLLQRQRKDAEENRNHFTLPPVDRGLAVA